MQRHNDVPKRSSPIALSQLGMPWFRRRLSFVAAIVGLVLALATLACAFIGLRSPSDAVGTVIVTRPVPTPDPNWSFVGVRVSTDDGGNLLLHGDAINNAGSSQEIVSITGLFYDAQGRVTADANMILEYWPLIDTIPPGGRVPFELTVVGIQSAANFYLSVEAEPSDETPRQDFEFSDLKQSNEAGNYCVTGKLRNPGDALQSYLVIVVVLYDDQDNVINFGDYGEFDVGAGGGDQTFEICIDPLNQDVARYELRAWGL